MALISVLKEQFERNEKNIAFYELKKSKLTKGSLHKKIINGKPYYYLKYRNDEGKRIDQYIKKSDLERVKQEIIKRKEIEKIIKELRKDIKLAKKVLGND